jgi:hypothetical protein
MNALAVVAVVLYVLPMALVFGGTAALSFAAAPQTFRALRPLDAGRVFGRVLRVFDSMCWVATYVAVVAGVLGLFAGGANVLWIVRLVLAGCVQAIVIMVRKGIAPRMAALKPPETEDEARVWDPAAKTEFDALHRLYVRLYACNLFLSLCALVVGVLPGA